MKKIIITLTLLLSIGALSAQNAISNHFSDYQEREDIIHISVTGKIFELMGHVEVETEEEKEFQEFVTSINRFEMIIGDEPVFSKDDFRSALGRVDEQYEELMSIEDKDGTFNFRIDERNGVVRELVMVAIADEDLIVFSLSGDMDLKQISKIGAQIQTEGFQYLEKIDEQAHDELKVYPNPVQSGGQLNIEIPEQYIDGNAVIYDMNGKVLMSYQMGLRKQRIELPDLPAGQYLVEFEQGGMKQSRKLTVK